MISTMNLRQVFQYEYKLGHIATDANKNIHFAFGEGSTNVRTLQG